MWDSQVNDRAALLCRERLSKVLHHTAISESGIKTRTSIWISSPPQNEQDCWNGAEQIVLSCEVSRPHLCLPLQPFLRNESIHTASPLESCTFPFHWNPVASISTRVLRGRAREGKCSWCRRDGKGAGCASGKPQAAEETPSHLPQDPSLNKA